MSIGFGVAKEDLEACPKRDGGVDPIFLVDLGDSGNVTDRRVFGFLSEPGLESTRRVAGVEGLGSLASCLRSGVVLIMFGGCGSCEAPHTRVGNINGKRKLSKG